MDIKQLKYLTALDQARHLGQAAVVCHITQPTLSMRIHGLEEELSLTPTQRGQRFEGFILEGERILVWARTVLVAHDGPAAEATICREQMIGQLRVGTVPLANLNPMQLIKPLAEKHPTLQFSLLLMTSEWIIDGVNRNQLDLDICYLQHLDWRLFKIARLPQTRVGFLHDKRYFDSGGGTPGWEVLATLLFGFLTKGVYYQESTETSFRTRGLTPKYVFESDSAFQIIQAVQAGIYCAIMPLNNGLEALSDDLKILPVVEVQVDSQLVLIMYQQEPISALTERCFAEAQGIFGQGQSLRQPRIFSSRIPHVLRPKIPTDSITTSILTTIKLIAPGVPAYCRIMPIRISVTTVESRLNE